MHIYHDIFNYLLCYLLYGLGVGVLRFLQRDVKSLNKFNLFNDAFRALHRSRIQTKILPGPSILICSFQFVLHMVMSMLKILLP